jgi:hypothetical protein
MKKPLTMPDEPQRNIMRADLPMTEGFGMESDGRMKTVGRGISKPSFRRFRSGCTTLRKSKCWNCHRLLDAIAIRFEIGPGAPRGST